MFDGILECKDGRLILEMSLKSILERPEEINVEVIRNYSNIAEVRITLTKDKMPERS